jgi:tetratricopeptide (TPR) repeat protein
VAYGAKDLVRAEAALVAAFKSGEDAAAHPFVRKYAGASTVTLEVADGVQVTMPLGREAVGLTLAELFQATGRLDDAINVVEQLEPTFSAALSLAELYSDAGRHSQVIDMTNGLANETDQHAFLLVLRGRALRESGMFDAARESLKEAMRRRSVDSEIRRRAYLERANTYLAQGRRAQARKDLERILAEDANYPGLGEALAGLDSEIKVKGAGPQDG